MQYRRLGRAGLQVSELSLGSWVTYANQVDVNAAVEMMAAAYDAGVNFFDNAEAYAGGKSEEVMGAALKKLGWSRLNYTVSTKFFWGLPDAGGVTVNRKNTLNRKYLMQAIDGSLQRFGLEHLHAAQRQRERARVAADVLGRVAGVEHADGPGGATLAREQRQCEAHRSAADHRQPRRRRSLRVVRCHHECEGQGGNAIVARRLRSC